LLLSWFRDMDEVTYWKAVARKLARWLPIDGTSYSVYRQDMPHSLLSEQMAPEDWVRMAQRAVEVREAAGLPPAI